jgi:hypothetical protein
MEEPLLWWRWHLWPRSASARPLLHPSYPQPRPPLQGPRLLLLHALSPCPAHRLLSLPLVPSPWRGVSHATDGFGHGQSGKAAGVERRVRFRFIQSRQCSSLHPSAGVCVHVHAYTCMCTCVVAEMRSRLYVVLIFFFISQPLKAETNITNEACLHKEGTKKEENIIKLAVHV